MSTKLKPKGYLRSGTTLTPLIAACFFAAQSPASAAGYTAETIEPPVNFTATSPSAVNDWGEVSGVFGGDGHAHPFIWSHEDGITKLVELPGAQNTDARGMNNCRVIVGTADTEFGPQRPVRWTSPTHIEDLGVYGPFLLDGVNYYNATGEAINDRGQIVGYTTSAERFSTAYRWTPGVGMELLGTLGGDTSAAGGINNRGDVVGYSTVANGDSHAFLWTESDGMIDLGTLPGGHFSSAPDVNDLRVVTGDATNAAGEARAFRWSRTSGMVDIGGLQGSAINVAGAITGSLRAPNGDTHVALWKPRRGPIDLSGNASDFAVGVDVNFFGVVAASISTLAEIPVIPTRAVIYRPPGYSATLVRAAKRAYTCPAGGADH